MDGRAIDDELLHSLRMRGAVEVEGEAPDRLVDAGFAVRRKHKLVLTPAGRVEADRRLSLEGQPGHEQVQTAYERFRPLNRVLLQLCTDWQVRAGGVPNDHRDSGYDWGVIDRLVVLDEQAGPVVRGIARHVPRFGTYRERLRAARKRVEDGEHDWFLSPRIDSYHTVWMELHEDLLVGLGLERSGERADG